MSANVIEHSIESISNNQATKDATTLQNEKVKLRELWEFAVIANFFTLFRSMFGIRAFSIEVRYILQSAYWNWTVDWQN